MINKTLIALSLTFALGACAQKANEAATEAAIEASTGGKADVDINGGNTKITMQTEQGQTSISAGENVAMPTDFPSDVVVAAEHKLISAITAGGGTSLTYITHGQLAGVVSAQDAAMKSNGWQQTMSMNTDAKSSMLGYSKDSRDAMLIYSAGDAGEVTVSVQLSAKQ